MPLPPPRKAGLQAGRQMQVELYKIPLPEALEILRRERFETVPYGCTQQMAFFSSLLKPIHAINLLLRNIKSISARGQFLLDEESRQPIILLRKTSGIVESPLGLQHGGP